MEKLPDRKDNSFLTKYAPINDALVQFIQFKNFLRLAEKKGLTIEDLRKIISESELKNIEEFSGKSKEELEKVKPGICEQYNLLIAKIQKSDLNQEELKLIIQEAESLIKIS